MSVCVAGCDFSAVDCEQKTALHWTATNVSSSCMQMILDLYPSLLNTQSVKEWGRGRGGEGGCVGRREGEGGSRVDGEEVEKRDGWGLGK